MPGAEADRPHTDPAESSGVAAAAAEAARSVDGVAGLEPDLAQALATLAPRRPAGTAAGGSHGGVRVTTREGIARVDVRLRITPPPDAAAVAGAVIARVDEAVRRVDGVTGAQVHVAVVGIGPA
jgi:uncharacterized alkaline shock family protein YloU